MESSDSKIDLYMGTAEFFVNATSEATKTTYRGQFKVKCLINAFDYIKADAYFRELIGKHNPEYATSHVTQLCFAFSQLKYRIIDHPEWFKDSVTGVMGGSLEDSLVLHIFEKCVSSEEEYRKQINEKYKKAKGEVKSAIDSGKIGGEEKAEEKDEVLGEE